MRHSHIACHAAALSWLLKRRLRLDPAREEFIDDSEANGLARYPRGTCYKDGIGHLKGLSAKLLAEFLGTLWLTFGGCGSAVLAALFIANFASKVE